MGFMGISCTVDSDAAADLAYTANKTLAKVLREELTDTGNAWNTPGPVNVALYLEEFVKTTSGSPELAGVVQKTINLLRERIIPAWPQEEKRLTELVAHLGEIIVE